MSINALDRFSKVNVKLRQFLSWNWGGFFVADFILLLIIAAVFLASGHNSLAEGIADVAYFSLVTGVILQLGYFHKKRGKVES